MSRLRIRCPVRLPALLGIGLVVACLGVDPPGRAGPRPVVRETRSAPVRSALAKVVVMPFEAAPDFAAGPSPGDAAAAEATRLVARFVSEALAKEGLEVVSPQEASAAFVQDVRTADAPAIARLAADRFRATGLIRGQVLRYRDRKGEALAAAQPASVSFEVQLYAAPSGRRLWSGRFAETQHSLDQKPLEAARYPGRGMRWLTAAELARWGAQSVARALRANP